MANDVEIVITSSDRSAAGVTSADKRIDDLRKSAIKKIDEINAKEIKLKADLGQAEAGLDRFKSKKETAAADAELKVRADIRSAEADLDRLHAKSGGVMTEEMALDISAAEAKVDRLKSKVETVGADAEAEVDLSISQAEANVDGLKRQLAGIGDARSKVDIDTADAARNIAEVDRQAKDATRDKRMQIVVDTASSVARVGALASAVAALAPVAFAAVGALAGIGSVGVGGLAATTAGFSGIGDAVKAMGEKSTGGGAAVKASAADIANAAQDVKSAEQDLADAQDDEKNAQEALTGAREDAARTLRDLAMDTEDMGLRQEDAALRVREMQVKLNAVNSDGKATSVEKARAELNLREAMFKVKEVQVESIDLSAKKNDADRKGIEGSDQVVGANKKIADSHRATEDAVVRLARAQQALIEAQTPKGGGGGGVDKQAEAMAKLTKEGREFAVFLRGFVDGPLKELKDSGQSAFLPGVQAGMKQLVPIMDEIRPKFAGFSRVLGTALGDLIPIIASMAPAFMRFATESLTGLSPLQDGLRGLATQMSGTLDALSAGGAAQAAMGELAGIINALLPLLPMLVQYGTELMVAMGPSLRQVVTDLVQVFRELLPALVEFAPAAGDLLTSVSGLLPPLAEFVGWLVNLNPQLVATVIGIAACVVAFQKLSSVVSGGGSALAGLASAFVDLSADTGEAATSTSGFAAAMTRLGTILAVVQAASAAFGSSAATGVRAASEALEDYARSGQMSSEVTKDLKYDLDSIANSTWSDRFFNGAAQAIEGITGLGSVMDKSSQHAAERLASMDAALADMASNGNADQAAAAFARLAQQAEAQSIPVERLKETFPQYAEALAQAADADRSATGALNAHNKALQVSADMLLDLRGAETGYYSALARSTEAVATNGRTVNVHTAAGRANRAALDDQSKAARDLLLSIQKNDGEGPKFTATQTEARNALIRTATQMGMTKTAAAQYADSIVKIPASKTSTIKFDNAAAMAAIGATKTAIASIPATKTSTITTIFRTLGSAASWVVPGSSRGGRVPGAPSMVDTEPHMLARGEFVVRSDRAQRFLPQLEAINSGQDPTSGGGGAGQGASAAGGGGASSGGGVGTVVLELRSSGSEIDDFLLELLRRAVRVRGGDVQVVMGQGSAA